ncbi:amidase [Qingshengfaniella alkalisoli]|uniref:Amidase n=1 Tax=Qingshengfaniella alkalisoli TaxID=2599296 RepID=A0A5B8IBC6_9RHOB|nr:amidase [Qingshengfaniella alkalisoli]QDY71489.1 amidase [Qingshengfaniella alkalisoli]
MGSDRKSGMIPLIELDAVALRDRIARGELAALDVVEAYIEQIRQREPEVQAWIWHDPDFARHQAKQLDAHRKSGKPLGRLHGLPVGIKDVIDTQKIPTGNGTMLDQGRLPMADAFVVKRLKQEGAIIMGKTVTTELAYLHPSGTRNPHNPDHTPGGSSAGSAAAVAAAMVPLAIGTQTGGSIIRPASFCGVTGFKPSFGAIPRTGVLMQSQTLDTVGTFAHDPAGAAMLAEVLFGQDSADPATTLQPFPALLDTAQADPPVAPRFAMIKPPEWDRADPDLHHAFEELAEHLHHRCFPARLHSQFDKAAEQRAIINVAEMVRCYQGYAARSDGLSDTLQEALDHGQSVSAKDYLTALDWRELLTATLDEIFQQCDAMLCPAALGPAPESHATTGDAIFNGLWTLCGVPAITIPVFTASNGMPMGLQLVGPRGDDARLLRNANWLYKTLAAHE